MNNGKLAIQASDNALTAVNTTLSVENATFGSGSTTTFTLNTDADMTASFIKASGDIVIENGAAFHVTSIPGRQHHLEIGQSDGTHADGAHRSRND